MEHFEQIGNNRYRSGVAKDRGMKSLCKKRVCFMTTDRALLEEILYTVSQSNDCIDVKFSTTAREGVYFGFSHFTNESSVGDFWAQYESHPKVWTTVQDEEFCDPYRGRIRTY
jgi:hypothetical protein